MTVTIVILLAFYCLFCSYIVSSAQLRDTILSRYQQEFRDNECDYPKKTDKQDILNFLEPCAVAYSRELQTSLEKLCFSAVSLLSDTFCRFQGFPGNGISNATVLKSAFLNDFVRYSKFEPCSEKSFAIVPKVQSIKKVNLVLVHLKNEADCENLCHKEESSVILCRLYYILLMSLSSSNPVEDPEQTNSVKGKINSPPSQGNPDIREQGRGKSSVRKVFPSNSIVKTKNVSFTSENRLRSKIPINEESHQETDTKSVTNLNEIYVPSHNVTQKNVLEKPELKEAPLERTGDQNDVIKISNKQNSISDKSEKLMEVSVRAKKQREILKILDTRDNHPVLPIPEVGNRVRSRKLNKKPYKDVPVEDNDPFNEKELPKSKSGQSMLPITEDGDHDRSRNLTKKPHKDVPVEDNDPFKEKELPKGKSGQSMVPIPEDGDRDRSRNLTKKLHKDVPVEDNNPFKEKEPLKSNSNEELLEEQDKWFNKKNLSVITISSTPKPQSLYDYLIKSVQRVDPFKDIAESLTESPPVSRRRVQLRKRDKLLSGEESSGYASFIYMSIAFILSIMLYVVFQKRSRIFTTCFGTRRSSRRGPIQTTSGNIAYRPLRSSPSDDRIAQSSSNLGF